jgi:hypothetical protein
VIALAWAWLGWPRVAQPVSRCDCIAQREAQQKKGNRPFYSAINEWQLGPILELLVAGARIVF